MNSLIACCGLDCSTCPIHLATCEGDPLKQQTMRREIADFCVQKLGMKLLPEEVTDCDGCPLPGQRLFSRCATCEIRKCAREKNLTSCAFCDSFACGKLLTLFETDPPARARLEALRGAVPPLRSV